ncbi:trypsin [Flavilitoribacter nigricans DSM 23189 = NBRC 102662]|uniref:Trypsin n=1 Tax=Flavilitoribacter nigricans (strain ATCC 23147 / DSM 23189 / NBRC 102662 / NCIMB 1420 / SS-2) TaxID=1122177 RepID=A0A2D0NBG1_FLAN2|nr:trypsin [Flavilitoribacter nigricans DSM 23189 = NBRC 102662]
MRSLTGQNLRSVLAIGFFLFICWIIFTADTGQVPPQLQQIRKLPYGDKVGHFTLYGMLAFLVNLALNHKRVRIFSLPVLSGALLVGIFAIVEEFTQIAFATRNFELMDMLCDLLGITVFSYLSLQLAAWLQGLRSKVN